MFDTSKSIYTESEMAAYTEQELMEALATVGMYHSMVIMKELHKRKKHAALLKAVKEAIIELKETGEQI